MGDPLASVAPGPGTFIVSDAHGTRIRPWWESSTRGPFYRAVETNADNEVVWDCGHDHFDSRNPVRAAAEANRCKLDRGSAAFVSQFTKPRRVAAAEAQQMQAQAQRLVDTAPPIVKTSGLSKAHRLTQSFQDHFDSWQAMYGRPLVVGDLSDQMRKAFHMDELPDTQVITKKLIERAARRYLRESENQMRESQNKRVTKEAFWVPAGVR